MASALTTLMLPEELKAGLKQLKVRDGISESEAMRRAIKEYLERKGILSGNHKRGSKV